MIVEKGTRLSRLLALHLMVATVLSAASVFAQSPTFARTDHLSLGNNHVVGDFNRDGKPDLAGQGAMSAAILLGNGDGTFQARVEYPVASWNQDLASGDFNGDGNLDLVVTINDPGTSLSLLTGNGDGTFDPPVNSPNTSHLDSPTVVATDLDNDGKLDVVIGHAIGCYTAPCITGQTISVMRGNGDGTFQPSREITVGTGISRIAVGDFNRDGIRDLGIAGDRSQVYVLLGLGDGTFNQQPTLTLIAENNLGMDNTDIDVADLNGDSVDDLVVALSLNGSRTAILLGNGDGTFGQALLITEPGIRVPQHQAVADYNGDGFHDLALALANGTDGLMEILNGRGDGTFQPPVLYLKPPSLSSIGAVSIIAADFNSDGKPDIALGWGGASSGLAALRNTTGSASAPSLNSVTVSPSSVVGGNPATGTVTLGAAAPSGGAIVALTDNSSAVATPNGVTVPAGSSSASFALTTSSVTASTTVTISAVHAGVTRTATLTVTAAGGGGSSAGYNSPSANARDSGGDGNGFESSPSNAHADDAASAADINSGSGTGTSCTSSGKDRHRFFNYGFSIPAGASVTGVEVRLDARADSTSGSPRMCVQLSWDGGTTWTAAKATAALGTSMTTFTLGGVSDPWGRTWSAANLADASFRVRVIDVSSSTSRDFFLDWVGVRPHYTITSSAPASLSAVSVSPSTVTGGSASNGTVTLTATAPAGGAVVSLASSNTSAATVPTSVTVAAGATSATFAAATSPVASNTSATITASYAGTSRTTTLGVTAPAAPTASATLTVTATGRSGERITSSPPGLDVSVGSTGSASFAIGTPITLTVTNGRDAVWSGACSSGGNKTRTCTFTLSATASVTGNVQ